MTSENKDRITRWSVTAGILGLGFLGMTLGGCVTAKAQKRAVDEAYAAGRNVGQAEHCGLIEAALNATSEELAATRDRLQKFNQVDAAGKLRSLKKQIKGK